MAQDVSTPVALGVGAIGVIVGLLVVVQIPASNQYQETTLSTVGIGVLLVLFGIKTIAESSQ